jgi:hypothetical protein
MSIKIMKLKPIELEEELRNILDSAIKRSPDFQPKISAPLLDPDYQFQSLALCLSILSKSKKKYVKKLESQLKTLEYDESVYSALAKTMDKGELDITKKADRALIDEQLLEDVIDVTNAQFKSWMQLADGEQYWAIRSGLQKGEKRNISDIALAPEKNANESIKTYFAKIKKQINARYDQNIQFGNMRSARLFITEKTIVPLLKPLLMFPLHKPTIETRHSKYYDGSFYKKRRLLILAKVTLDIQIEASNQFFKENEHVYDEIDSLLTKYHHHDVNINDCVSLCKKLMVDFQQGVENQYSDGYKLPGQARYFEGLYHVDVFRRDDEWRLNNWESFDISSILTGRFFMNMRDELLTHDLNFNKNKSGRRYRTGQHVSELPQYIFNIASSFSSGFDQKPNQAKSRAADQLAKLTIDELVSHLKSLNNKKTVSSWLEWELQNFLELNFAMDGKINKVLEFEKMPPEGILNHWRMIQSQFLDNRKEIVTLQEKYNTFKKDLQAKVDNKVISSKKYSAEKLKFIEKNIPHRFLRYFSAYWLSLEPKVFDRNLKLEREKVADLLANSNQTHSKENEIFLSHLRHKCILEADHNGIFESDLTNIKSQPKFTNPDQLLWSFVPTKDFSADNLFVLKKMAGNRFDDKTALLIKKMLWQIEQDPIMAIKLMNLFDAKAKNAQRQPENNRLFWIVSKFIRQKYMSILDTHFFSLADTLSRVLLFINGVYPYKEGFDDDKYKRILSELENLIFFFENYLEGIIATVPFKERPLNKKLLVWEIKNNLHSIKKYILTLQHTNIDQGHSSKIPGYDKDFSYEQLFSIAKKSEKKRKFLDVLDPKCLELYSQGNGFKRADSYLKHNFIANELRKKNTLLKRSKTKSFIERGSAIKWLKNRPSTKKFKSLREVELKEDLGYSSFAMITEAKFL